MLALSDRDGDVTQTPVHLDLVLGAGGDAGDSGDRHLATGLRGLGDDTTLGGEVLQLGAGEDVEVPHSGTVPVGDAGDNVLHPLGRNNVHILNVSLSHSNFLLIRFLDGSEQFDTMLRVCWTRFMGYLSHKLLAKNGFVSGFM